MNEQVALYGYTYEQLKKARINGTKLFGIGPKKQDEINKMLDRELVISEDIIKKFSNIKLNSWQKDILNNNKDFNTIYKWLIRIQTTNNIKEIILKTIINELKESSHFSYESTFYNPIMIQQDPMILNTIDKLTFPKIDITKEIPAVFGI